MQLQVPRKNQVYTPERVSVLQSLDASTGLTPEALVQLARDPNSCWHDQFDWDDRRLAHAARLAEARHFIAGYRVEVVIEDAPVSIKYFVSKPSKEAPAQRGGYGSVKAMVRSKTATKQFVVNGLRPVLTQLDGIINPARLAKLDVQKLEDAYKLIEEQLKAFE